MTRPGDAGCHGAVLLIAITVVLAVVGVFVVVAQILQVRIAIDLVHSINHPLRQARQLVTRQNRDRREQRSRAG